MKNKILNKLMMFCLALVTLTACGDLELQENYDYDSSVADPHINMTAWEFFQSRQDIFSELTKAIEYTELKDYYTQTETLYTFLALNNDAIRSYMEKNFPGIENITDCDKAAVKNLLLYHIIDGEYSSYGQLPVEPQFVITLLQGEEGLMTMCVRKNPWQGAVGQIVINNTGSNGKSPMRTARTSNIMPVNGVIHVFDKYCYYQK